MAKTEVILTHNIVDLGGESDQVKVASGYARNYLIPQHLAIPVTQANKRQMESLKQRRAEREAHDLNAMTELSKAFGKLVLVIKVKTGEDGKMFGTVTAGLIADELKKQFDITLDKRKIHLREPLRQLGEHDIELNLHHEVKGTLKLRIESTTPITVPTPATADDKKPHTEKRGKREAEKTVTDEIKPKTEKKAKVEKKVKAQ